MKNDDRDISNFDKLAAKTKEQLARTKDKSSDWLHAAIEAASNQLESAGEFSKEEGHKAKEFLKRDLAATKEDFAQASEKIGRGLSPSRLGTGIVSLTSHLLGSMGETFQSWAHKSDDLLTFKTGQITGPGTLTCSACGTAMHPADTGRIPPCPKCHKTEFRKSY